MTLAMMGVAAITTVLLLVLRRKKYDMSWLAVILILLTVGIIGYYGAAFASFLSYGSWNGIRFYGKALFATIALFLSSKVMRINCFKVMDYYAPVDIFALIIMKINCARAGCCAGIKLFSTDGSDGMIFPSQYVELVVAGIIFLAILVLEMRNCGDGYRYSMYITVYGVTRFVLDSLREEPGKMINLIGVQISITQIICLILTGLGILLIINRVKKEIQISTLP